MASGDEPRPYVSFEDVTNKITLNSDKGTVSQYTAIKTGALVSISFVFTPTQSLSSGESVVFNGTYSEARLKPCQRSQIGGCNVNLISVYLANVTGNYEVTMIANRSAAFWLHFIYMCND